jgi:hypothetical protein
LEVFSSAVKKKDFGCSPGVFSVPGSFTLLPVRPKSGSIRPDNYIYESYLKINEVLMIFDGLKIEKF